MRIKYFLLFCFIQFIISLPVYSQSSITTVFDSTETEFTLDELNSFYGNNKVIPEHYQVPLLIALSYYPELRNTRIVFKEASISTTLNVRPTLGSILLRKKSKRKHVVRINTQAKNGIVLIGDVPELAQIGLFGHELAHILDYTDKNALQVGKTACSYFNRDSKAHYERSMDALTISQGMGAYLFSWTNYVLHSSHASKEYKEFKRSTYMRPKEIKKALEVQNQQE